MAQAGVSEAVLDGERGAYVEAEDGRGPGAYGRKGERLDGHVGQGDLEARQLTQLREHLTAEEVVGVLGQQVDGVARDPVDDAALDHEPGHLRHLRPQSVAELPRGAVVDARLHLLEEVAADGEAQLSALLVELDRRLRGEIQAEERAPLVLHVEIEGDPGGVRLVEGHLELAGRQLELRGQVTRQVAQPGQVDGRPAQT